MKKTMRRVFVYDKVGKADRGVKKKALKGVILSPQHPRLKSCHGSRANNVTSKLEKRQTKAKRPRGGTNKECERPKCQTERGEQFSQQKEKRKGAITVWFRRKGGPPNLRDFRRGTKRRKRGGRRGKNRGADINRGVRRRGGKNRRCRKVYSIKTTVKKLSREREETGESN